MYKQEKYPCVYIMASERNGTLYISGKTYSMNFFNEIIMSWIPAYAGMTYLL